MRVLVTGGAGFIGSHVVDALVAEDYRVAVVDNLSAGKKKNVNDGAKLYNVDICDAPALRKVFEREKPFCVVHHAAQINVRASIKDPVFDARTNVLGSLNLLECCREFHVEKMIYASSGGAVYGEPRYLPVDEEHPIAPLSPYGASKYTVENYLNIYCKLCGLDYTVLRYGNVYGPRQDASGEAGVVAIFTDRMLAGQGITINGDGRQTRDFVFVVDVAKANLAAFEKSLRDKVFNIGSSKPTSVNEIARGLEDAVGWKVKAKHAPEIKGEVRHIFLDIRRARKQLGFRPKVLLKEGLRETVEWAKAKLAVQG